MKNDFEIMFRWCLTYDAVYINDNTPGRRQNKIIMQLMNDKKKSATINVLWQIKLSIHATRCVLKREIYIIFTKMAKLS